MKLTGNWCSYDWDKEIPLASRIMTTISVYEAERLKEKELDVGHFFLGLLNIQNPPLDLPEIVIFNKEEKLWLRTDAYRVISHLENKDVNCEIAYLQLTNLLLQRNKKPCEFTGYLTDRCTLMLKAV